MGQWDYKNWLVKVELKEDLTDPQFYEYLSTHKQFTLKEYRKFEKSLIRPLHNDKAEKILRFFLDYHNGELYPDRYNYFEPVNKVFTEDMLSDFIDCLCQPAGGVYLKKLRKYYVEIDNKQFGICFTDNIYAPPTVSPPENLTSITMWFDKKKVKDCSTLFGLADDLVAAFGAVKGAVIDQEDLHAVYECPIPE